MNIKKVEFKFSSRMLLKELARKLIHISACVAALISIRYDLTVIQFLILPAITISFYISEKIDFFGKNISLGNKRKWGGILLGIGLTLIIFAPLEYEVKKFSILVLMIADVMAALVGKIVPVYKVEVLGAFKSLGGCSAFIVGVLIALGLSFGWESSLLQGPILVLFLILPLLEFLNWRGIDNVTLPLASLLLASLL